MDNEKFDSSCHEVEQKLKAKWSDGISKLLKMVINFILAVLSILSVFIGFAQRSIFTIVDFIHLVIVRFANGFVYNKRLKRKVYSKYPIYCLMLYLVVIKMLAINCVYTSLNGFSLGNDGLYITKDGEKYANLNGTQCAEIDDDLSDFEDCVPFIHEGLGEVLQIGRSQFEELARNGFVEETIKAFVVDSVSLYNIKIILPANKNFSQKALIKILPTNSDELKATKKALKALQNSKLMEYMVKENKIALSLNQIKQYLNRPRINYAVFMKDVSEKIFYFTESLAVEEANDISNLWIVIENFSTEMASFERDVKRCEKLNEKLRNDSSSIVVQNENLTELVQLKDVLIRQLEKQKRFIIMTFSASACIVVIVGAIVFIAIFCRSCKLNSNPKKTPGNQYLQCNNENPTGNQV